MSLLYSFKSLLASTGATLPPKGGVLHLNSPVEDRAASMWYTWILLFTVLSLICGCSKIEKIDGEVFVSTTGGTKTIIPYAGVQVYFFTEKQMKAFQDELEDWRTEKRRYSTNTELQAEWTKLFESHGDENRKISKDKVPVEVWNRVSELEKLLERASPDFWKNLYPAVFDKDEYLRRWDFEEITNDAIWVVTDPNGKFDISLKLGRVYWVWCSGATEVQTEFVRSPWFFKYVPDGGKLVLTNVNRIKLFE